MGRDGWLNGPASGVVKAKADWDRVKVYALVLHGIALVASYICARATIGVYGWTLVVFFGCGMVILLASMIVLGSMMGKERDGRGAWPTGVPAGGMVGVPAADDVIRVGREEARRRHFGGPPPLRQRQYWRRNSRAVHASITAAIMKAAPRPAGIVEYMTMANRLRWSSSVASGS